MAQSGPGFPLNVTYALPRKSEGPVSFLPALGIALNSLRNFGAGEGIRTLDPNLGKVVLYP